MTVLLCQATLLFNTCHAPDFTATVHWPPKLPSHTEVPVVTLDG